MCGVDFVTFGFFSEFFLRTLYVVQKATGRRTFQGLALRFRRLLANSTITFQSFLLLLDVK